MEASTDQDLSTRSRVNQLFQDGTFEKFGVKLLSPANPFDKDCVRIVKPLSITQGYSVINDDYQTVNRQKVSPLGLDVEYPLSSQSSNEEGQILNVQYKCLKRDTTILNGKNGMSAFCVAQRPSNPFVASNFQFFCQSVKPKTQEISKVIQDITADWNSQPPGKGKRDHHCHFDKEVSDDSVQEILSDAGLHCLDQGTFGRVFTSTKEPTLVVKRTLMPVNPNEVLVPLRLKGCSNILQIHAVDVRNGMFSIVQQHCGDSLKKLIKDAKFNNFFKDTTKRRNFVEGMFKGVEVLEKSKACHGDLKLENICAKVENDTYVPRLIDFGTCQASSDKPSLEGISPEFLPPKVNTFALQVIEKSVSPLEQGMLLFNEKSDSWSVAMVTVCLCQEGMHPLTEVQSYVNFDLRERVIAMQKIAQLTEQDVDKFVPPDLDPVMKVAVRENLRVNADQRWGAHRTVEHLRKARLQQEGSKSPEDDVNLKRGKKRPVSPFHPATARHRNEDDVSELMDLFKSFQKKKPPDEVNVPRFKPRDDWQGESVTPNYFEGKVPLTQVPEKARSLISTLKFKPGQQSQGEVKVRRKEVLYPPDNLLPTVPTQPQGIVPGLPSSNIPNMMKLEESQPCDLEGFKVKTLLQKVVHPEDEAKVMVTNSPLMPDFDLLGMDCDMNNEPPAENPTTHRTGGKTCRRRGSTKAKSFLK